MSHGRFVRPYAMLHQILPSGAMSHERLGRPYVRLHFPFPSLPFPANSYCLPHGCFMRPYAMLHQIYIICPSKTRENKKKKTKKDPQDLPKTRKRQDKTRTPPRPKHVRVTMPIVNQKRHTAHNTFVLQCL